MPHKLLAITVLSLLLSVWAPGAVSANQPDGSPDAPPSPEYLVRRKIPEKVLGAGLAWSRVHHPEFYAAGNVRKGSMEAVPPGKGKAGVQRRVMNVANNTYTRRRIKDFTYEDSRVTVEYLERADTFVARLSAHGLKPNFAYQIKLRGLFKHRDAFERIGYTGRWRLPDRGTHCRDDQYENAENKDEANSYLLFDYFVTDNQGNAVKWLYADSCLHVLFNASRQRNPSEIDALRRGIPMGGINSEAYANPDPITEEQYVYAQSEEDFFWENNRKPIGMAYLPPGRYRAELTLTEESFHDDGDGGFWNAAMRMPVGFTVVDASHRPYGWTDGSPVGDPFSVDSAVLRKFDDSTVTDGVIEAEGSGWTWITFSDTREIPLEGRFYLAVPVWLRDVRRLRVWLDTGAGFRRSSKYRLATGQEGVWQRVEMEATSRLAGRTVQAVRIQFRGGNRMKVKLRAPALYHVRDSTVDYTQCTAQQLYESEQRFQADTMESDVGASTREDHGASNGRARTETRKNPNGEPLVVGPELEIPPGKYRVKYRMKYTGENEKRPVATADITGGGEEVLAKYTVFARDLSLDGEYVTLSLSFETPRCISSLQFRVIARVPGITVDWCSIERVNKRGW